MSTLNELRTLAKAILASPDRDEMPVAEALAAGIEKMAAVVEAITDYRNATVRLHRGDQSQACIDLCDETAGQLDAALRALEEKAEPHA